MIINVHAGHNPDGMTACGAVGLIKESTENRKVKDLVIRYLMAQGHTVYDCTVENGTSQSDVLKKIVSKCNSHSVDLDVSIHFNSGANDKSGNGKTTGTEVLVYKAGNAASVYAVKICAAIAELGFKNRGVKERPGLYVLKNTKAPALLVECCFVDDADDVSLYDADKMAKAIVKGITGQAVESDTSSGDGGTNKKTVIYRVQVGAYKEKENADKIVNDLQKLGYSAIIVSQEVN